MLAPIYETTPQKIKDRTQWVVWKLEPTKDGKFTKVPYNPKNPKYKASSTNSKTWGTFEQARQAARGNGFAGIGYMFSKGCPYSGVDLDHCRDPKTGEIEPWARKEIQRLDSYSEVSPSGTGVKLWVEGQLPPGGRKKGNYEMYSDTRFFTVTGHHLKDTPPTIEPRQVELEALHGEVFGKPQDSPKESKPGPQLYPTPTLRTDREIIEKFKTAKNGDKFSRLMAGDFSAYLSHNEADMALCSMVAFYTQDPAQIDRIIRQSGLMRAKWNRRTASSTYGMITIDKVLGRLTEIYLWPQPNRGNRSGRQTAPEVGGGESRGESEPKRIPWIGHNYFVERGRLCLETYDREGMPKTSYLANFQARITEEITKDDGLRAVKEFSVKGSLDTGWPLPLAQIQAREFDSLAWVRREWGVGACQAPGRSLSPHLVNAIQAHSQGLKRRTVFAHSGWRKIRGVWRYLHGGGAIGGGDPVEVDLGGNLQLYRLPDPGGVEAAQASLRFLEVGPWEVTAPLIACAFLAPLADLCKIDFSLWIYGPTGSLKSTIAALALSHFGNFSRTTLPGSWFSTANSLEKLCFTLKDSLAVIDDFIPPSSPKESHTQTEKAARLIYQAGNRSSRGRLAADLSARPNHYPRCLIVSTGEMLLPGQRQSATARYLGIELDPKRTPIDKARLTAAQGECHLYPGAMAAYLAELAQRLEDTQVKIKELWECYRTAFQSTAHLRIPEIQAWLAVGFEMFLRFQARMGAISEGQANEMLNRAWKVFEALGEKHSRIIEGQRPTLKFLAVLKELFYQGRIFAESASTAGIPPQAGESLGWEETEPTKNAEFVGWADESSLYLMPETTLRVVNEAIRRQGDFLALGRNDLLAALAREGFIEPDKKHGKNTQVKWIQGGSKRVICLPLEKLAHDEVMQNEKE